jgi:hypothetical protein
MQHPIFQHGVGGSRLSVLLELRVRIPAARVKSLDLATGKIVLRARSRTSDQYIYSVIACCPTDDFHVPERELDGLNRRARKIIFHDRVRKRSRTCLPAPF